MQVRITKISDDVFKQVGEEHSRGINEGFILEGLSYSKPKVGERFSVGGIRGFVTSTIIEIIDENTFKTKNSTYKIEYLNE